MFLLSYPQLFVIVAETERRVRCLAFTEHYRWADFISPKHGSFSCINHWFNVGGVGVGVISANVWFSHVGAMNTECPERRFTPPNLAAVVDNIYIHIRYRAFVDWFLTTRSGSHQRGYLGASFRILSDTGRLFFLSYFLAPLRPCLHWRTSYKPTVSSEGSFIHTTPIILHNAIIQQNNCSAMACRDGVINEPVPHI